MSGRADGHSEAAAASRLERILDTGAVRHNLTVLRDAAGGRRIMAVVKGDAYGFGAPNVAGLLVDAGVDALAVDTVAEGVQLRDAAVRTPILVMDVDVADNAAACAEYDLMPAIATAGQVRVHRAAATRRPGPRAVWLRTNVGFNRFGERGEGGFDRVADELAASRTTLRVAGLFAHLSSAAADPAETAQQAAAFRSRAARARERFGPACDVSLAATHGLAHPQCLEGTDWVRPGIGLYGLIAGSAHALPDWPACGLDRLRPALTVRARVLEIVEAPGSEGVGYGRATRPAAGTRLASVAIGFSRGLAGAGPGLTGVLHGEPCPLVGRPGMDCTQFDVSAVPAARPGDWMTFIAPHGPDAKDAERTAAELGRTLYELLATFRMPVRLSPGPTARQALEKEEAHAR